MSTTTRLDWEWTYITGDDDTDPVVPWFADAWPGDRSRDELKAMTVDQLLDFEWVQDQLRGERGADWGRPATPELIRDEPTELEWRIEFTGPDAPREGLRVTARRVLPEWFLMVESVTVDGEATPDEVLAQAADGDVPGGPLIDEAEAEAWATEWLRDAVTFDEVVHEARSRHWTTTHLDDTGAQVVTVWRLFSEPGAGSPYQVW